MKNQYTEFEAFFRTNLEQIGNSINQDLIILKMHLFSCPRRSEQNDKVIRAQHQNLPILYHILMNKIYHILMNRV